MSDQSPTPNHDDDGVLNIIKDAVEHIPGMSIMSDVELAGFIEAGERMIAEHDDHARAEGRRFVSEENDQALIESWWNEAETCKSIDDAAAFAHRLVTDYRHDYGTICHAIAAAGVAMANAVEHSPQGHITGFQAGAIGWMLHRRWEQWDDNPRRIINYGNLLLPQYDHTFTEISQETAEWLIEEAKRKIAAFPDAHPRVLDRWEEVAAGRLPSFITVEAA